MWCVFCIQGLLMTCYFVLCFIQFIFKFLFIQLYIFSIWQHFGGEFESDPMEDSSHKLEFLRQDLPFSSQPFSVFLFLFYIKAFLALPLHLLKAAFFSQMYILPFMVITVVGDKRFSSRWRRSFGVSTTTIPQLLTQVKSPGNLT